MPPKECPAVVGHSSSAYERELRRLLEGERAAVRDYSRRLPPTERSEFGRITEEPFLIIRAAGSLGFDLVAMCREFSFPIEVKASSEDVIRFSAASGRANEQWESHRRAVERVGLAVLYAYRRIGLRESEVWRLFTSGELPKRGILRLVCSRLPPVGQTPEGNGVLRWEEGMPLSRFLYLVHSLTRTEGRSGG
jgi:Holliday junction resolvase